MVLYIANLSLALEKTLTMQQFFGKMTRKLSIGIEKTLTAQQFLARCLANGCLVLTTRYIMYATDRGNDNLFPTNQMMAIINPALMNSANNKFPIDNTDIWLTIDRSNLLAIDRKISRPF